MDNTVRVLKYFRKEISDLADAEESSINKEVNSIIDETISDYTSSVKAQAAYVLKHNKDEMNALNSKSIANLNLKRNTALNHKRDELCNEVFKEAKDELIKYTSQDEYQKSLLSKLKKCIEKMKIEKGVIFLKKDDQKLSKEILKLADLEIKESDKVSIGGFILEDASKGIVIDESYDMLLESQKEWYYLNSGLYIK